MGRIIDYPVEINPENSDVILLDGDKGTRTIAYEDLKKDIVSDVPVPDPDIDIEKYQEETTPIAEDLLFLDGTKGPRKITYETLKENITSDIPIPDPVLDIEKYPAETTPDNADVLFLDGTKGPRNITYEALKNTLPQGAKGDPGEPGKDGRSITSITTDEDENIIVNFSDGTSQNIGKLSVDVQADFLTEEGFGNLRYYNSKFQSYDAATDTWNDIQPTADNPLIMNLAPQPMQRMFVNYDVDKNAYKITFKEPKDTIVNNQMLVAVEGIKFVRKLDSEPTSIEDGTLVLDYKRRDFANYNQTYFYDTGFSPTRGENWFYKAFPYSTNGVVGNSSDNVASCVAKDYYLYGFKIDQNESDPFSMITYPEGVYNEYYQSAYMNYNTDTFVYGDWADAFFMKVRPCMLKYDGTVDYYLNPNNYGLKEDGTPSDISDVNYEGNVMIEFPKTYWKIVDNGNDTANIYICDKKIDDKFHCWSHIDANGNEIPYCYMPAYSGYSDGTRSRSLSGKTPTTSTIAQQEVSLALRNNMTDIVEWYTEVYSDWQMVDLLLLLIGKSTDSQVIFGTGNNGSYISDSNTGLKTTGTLNLKGLFWGNQDNVSCVKVFGMENWYGNVWRRIAGWINDHGTQKVKMTYGQSDGSTVDGYNFDGNGYITIQNASPGGTNGGYISKMAFDKYGVLPKTASGSATTYYTDGLWFNNSLNSYAAVGGASVNGSFVGALSSGLNVVSSGAMWYIGSSISCKPLSKTGGAA